MNSLRCISSVASSVLPSPFNVLGVESSFDDSAVAILDSNGHTHAHLHCSQMLHHLSKGGVNPIIASEMHERNLPPLLDKCFTHSGLAPTDIHVVAFTKGPGLGLSLQHGLNLSVKFFREHLSYPPCLLIGVHHMLAHALIARLTHSVNFPFLTLLVSGAHCLLCVVRSVKLSEVIRIGTALDAPPGNVLDHGSRLLGLSEYPEFSKCSGGQAIERISLRGKMPYAPLKVFEKEKYNFSFSGMLTNLQNKFENLSKSGTVSYQDKADLALWFQTSLVQHIISRANRAMLYAGAEFPDVTNFVVSGGVAQNFALQKAISDLCSKHNLCPVYPPPALCADNAVMIAWAGVECARAGVGVESPDEEIRYIPKWKLGTSLIDCIT